MRQFENASDRTPGRWRSMSRNREKRQKLPTNLRIGRRPGGGDRPRRFLLRQGTDPEDFAYISVKSSDGLSLLATLSVSGAASLDKGFTGTAANAADQKGATEAILIRPATSASGFFKVQGL